jgi:3D (Asp-Asp-Asp) domain-containing protein
MATAYSVEGITRKGTQTEYGVVAADRSVLPLGTRLHVTGANEYSGVFVVEDTGAKVEGNHIDIYLPDDRAAKQFGVRLVGVEVIEWGDDEVLPQAESKK